MFRPFGNTTGPATPFGTPQPPQPAAGSFAFGAPGFGTAGATQPSALGAFGTGFGTGGGFGAAAARPRYSVTTDMEGDSKIYLQTITAMPAYLKQSQEELRLEDYMAGRKGGTPFGAIGQPVPSQTTFGAAQQPAAPSAFGTALAPTGLFGASASSGPAVGVGTGGAGGGGLFGVPNATQPSAFGGFGGFGQGTQQSLSQPPPQPTSSLFGGTAAAPGSFGTAAPQAGMFGSQPQFGAFGKPATQPASTTGVFGGFGTAAGQPSTTASSLFGNAPVSAAAPTATTAPFGMNQPTTGGLFGAKPATSTTTSLGFNAPAPAPAVPTFLGPSQTSSTSGAGLFGLNPSATSATQSIQPTAAANGFALGGTQSSTAAQPSTGFFGGAFPSSTAPTSSGYSFNLGGGSTSLGNLGAAPTSTLQTTSQSAVPSGFSFNLGGGGGGGGSGGGGGALGAQSAPLGFGFGPGPGTGSTFGGLGGAQPSLGLSGSSTAAGTSAAPALPLIPAESLSIKPPLPVALTTPKTETAPPSSSSAASKLTPSSRRSPQRHTPRASFRLSTPAEVAPPPSTAAASSFGTFSTSSGFILPRKVSAKKLVVESSNVSTVPGSRFATLSRMSSHAELAAAAAATTTSSSETPAAESSEQSLFGEKYMIPSEATLRRLPYAQLCAVHNFTVGERGVGQVRFLQPVDLTKVVLSDIFERIVVFEPRLVTLYPDDEFSEEEKPPVGSGLNVAAEVRLERCWCLSKSDRQPIKDMGDARLQAHIERLKSMEDTKFVDYLPETGTWIFLVEHFSSYGPDQVRPAAPASPSSSSQTTGWQQLTLECAKQTFAGEGRRWNFSWSPSGGHLVARATATVVHFVRAPCGSLRCGRSLEERLQTPHAFHKKDLTSLLPYHDLSKALGETEQRAAVINWLTARLQQYQHHQLDPAVWAIALGKYPSLESLLQAVGLERLAVMARLKASHQIPHLYEQTVVSLARVQQELVDPGSPLIGRFVLSVVAAHLSPSAHSPTIPWEAGLLSCLHYPPRSLPEALAAFDDPSDQPVDPAWSLLQLVVTQGREHLSPLLRPWGGCDWSLPYLLLQLVATRITIPPEAILHVTRQLIGQLLAINEWHLIPALCPSFDIGPLVQVEFASSRDVEQYSCREAAATRHLGPCTMCVARGRLLRSLQRPVQASQELIRGGALAEALEIVRPLVLDAFVAGSDRSRLLEGIPASLLDPLLKAIIVSSSNATCQASSVSLDSFQPLNLQEKAACQLLNNHHPAARVHSSMNHDMLP